MRRLTLIRHAMTDWNASGRFQGHTDRALNDDGRKQAHCLARHVAASEDIDIVFSSPLARARETAEIAFPNHRLVLDERLKELDFGRFEGHTEAENQMDPEWAYWYQDPYLRPAPGGESYRELRFRAAAWFADLPKLGHVVAVTHSGTIQMLLAHILGLEHPRWRKRIYLRHTGISRILVRDDDRDDEEAVGALRGGEEVLIERVNDTRHLARNGVDPFLD